MSAAGVGELYFLERNMNSNMYCEILQQSMIPSLQKLGRRAVFQQDNDSKHTSKTTIALLKRLRVNLAKHVSWREPNRTSLRDPQAEGGGVQSLKYLPAPWRHHGGVKEHSRGYLWGSGKVHAQEIKDGGHTKYWHLTWCMVILTTFPKGCTHFCWQGFSI